jgi:hypothetical protein
MILPFFMDVVVAATKRIVFQWKEKNNERRCSISYNKPNFKKIV